MCGDVPGTKTLLKMSKNVSYATLIYLDFINFFIDTSLRNGPGYVHTIRRVSVNGLFVRYVPNTNTYVDQSHSGNFLNQFKYMQPVYVLAKQPADKQTGT